MTNYFEMKAKMTAINANLRKAHPDWDSKRIYAATKAIALGTGKKTAETVEETVAVETVMAE